MIRKAVIWWDISQRSGFVQPIFLLNVCYCVVFNPKLNFKWEEFNFESSLNAKSPDAPVLERAFFCLQYLFMYKCS